MSTNRNYNLSNRVMACVLLVGLFLQSCGGSFNSSIPSMKEAMDDTPAPTKTREITKQLLSSGLMADVVAAPLLCTFSRGRTLRRGATSSLYLATYSRSYSGLGTARSTNQPNFILTTARHHMNKYPLISGKYSPKSFVHSCNLCRMGSVRAISQEKGQNEKKGKEGKYASKVNANTRLILSLDGGGIRGLLPAYVLNELEQELEEVINKHDKEEKVESKTSTISDIPKPDVRLGECFDIIAGTSTGGIIALAMRQIDPKTNRPCRKMQEILNIYQNRGKEIFPNRSKIQKLVGYSISMYDAQPLEAVLKEYFGETTLKDIHKPTVITSYSLRKEGLELFRSHKPHQKHYNLVTVARATSAAPTYFPAVKVTSSTEEGIKDKDERFLVDGGIIVNNPTMCAYDEAKKLNSKASWHVISLGTGRSNLLTLEKNQEAGKAGWAADLITVIMNRSSEIIEDFASRIIKKYEKDKYSRLQFELDKTVDGLDNADEDNISRLIGYGERIKDKPVFKNIKKALTRFYKKRNYYIYHDLVAKVRKQVGGGTGRVDLSKCYLTNRAMWEITHALLSTSHISSITDLNLSDNDLSQTSLNYLKNFTKLTDLDLSNTNLTIEWLEDLKSIQLPLTTLKAYDNPKLNETEARLDKLADAIDSYTRFEGSTELTLNLLGYYTLIQNNDKRSALLDMIKQQYVEKGKTLEQAADGGDAYAQTILGLYEESQHPQKAFELFERAAGQSNPAAQYSLGRMCQYGIVVPKNNEKALDWFEKAASQGYVAAQYKLACMYEAKEDYKNNTDWLQKAANQGYISAQTWLVNKLYLRDQDYEETVKYCLEAAKKGDTYAQYSLGFMYEYGLGTKQDHGKARDCYQDADETGIEHLELYKDAQKARQDYLEASKLFEEAKKGKKEAQYVLGWRYEHGDREDIEKNEEMAIDWFKKAAEQGYVLAQYRLACFYQAKQYWGKALEWFKKAAEQEYIAEKKESVQKGYLPAQIWLGNKYYYGQGVTQSYMDARAWYEKAASRGNAYSQYRLGFIYEYGLGVLQDYEKALEWYKKAAENKDKNSQARVIELSWVLANKQR